MKMESTKIIVLHYDYITITILIRLFLQFFISFRFLIICFKIMLFYLTFCGLSPSSFTYDNLSLLTTSYLTVEHLQYHVALYSYHNNYWETIELSLLPAYSRRILTYICMHVCSQVSISGHLPTSNFAEKQEQIQIVEVIYVFFSLSTLMDR